MKKFLFCILFIASVSVELYCQTIAEKKAALVGGVSDLDQELQQFLGEVNKEIKEWHEELQTLYDEVLDLYQTEAAPEDYKQLLDEINQVRENIKVLQESWREIAIKKGKKEEEYALWHQPETTIGQLVIDYGSQDYVYLISPELTTIPLSVNSNIPIPRSSWGEMLEQILIQNGIGIRELNPFLRQLYLIEEDKSGLMLITNNRGDLEVFPPNAHVSFVITPEPAEVRRTWFFLNKFSNPKSMSVQVVGRVILIVGQVNTVKELLKVYDFVDENRSDLNYKAIALRSVDVEQMAKILDAVFESYTEEVGEEGKKTQVPTGNSLKVIALSEIAQSLFLVGTQEEIQQAEKIIREVENQVGEAREKVIHWYHVRHSDAAELAEVLEKIYAMLIETRKVVDEKKKEVDVDKAIEVAVTEAKKEAAKEQPDLTKLYKEKFYQEGGYIINPAPIQPGISEKKDFNKDRTNFIVDGKSGSIVMVVEADILPRMKDLIRKLDVPKKMVQIDVLLFEKIMKRENTIGLNLLRTGDAASNTHRHALTFNDITEVLTGGTEQTGVLQFLLSREKFSNGFPAFDLLYKFLISQEDVSINANPSVITVNQTPALIAIKDEISLNTGTNFVPIEGTNVLAQSFTRAQYGITIEVTPIIHMHDEEGEDPTDYITLITDITFDTFRPGREPDRPLVGRRQIKNEVRIPDGETVIMGGLRNKTTNDSKDSIPFLGEIPGFGKLFSLTNLEDESTDMFIFLTPKIILDPQEDIAQIRAREMCRRPGDIPEFMCLMNEARECEKNRLFKGTMTMLFGRPRDRCVDIEGEWDGR